MSIIRQRGKIVNGPKITNQLTLRKGDDDDPSGSNVITRVLISRMEGRRECQGNGS